MQLAFCGTRAYLAINPDIVATLEGLAPQGAGTNRPVMPMRPLETEWPISRALQN